MFPFSISWAPYHMTAIVITYWTPLIIEPEVDPMILLVICRRMASRSLFVTLPSSRSLVT